MHRYRRSRLYGKGEVEEKEYLKKSTKSHRQSLGQFMTPAKDVDDAFRDIKVNINDKVLEPSYGTGNFLDGIIKRGYKNITGVEFDPILYNEFKDKYEKLGVKCINGDYLMTDFTNKMDLIVGNPPYFVYGGKGHPKLPEEIKKKYKDVIKGSVDIYGLFCVKAVKDLKENGICCFYIPATILNTSGFKLVRDYLHKNVNIERCEMVKNKEFKETKVENLMMFQFRKTTPTNDFTFMVGKNLYFDTNKKPKFNRLANVGDDVERVGDLAPFRSGDYEFDKERRNKGAEAFSDKPMKGAVPLIYGENLKNDNTLDLSKQLKKNKDSEKERKAYMITKYFKPPTKAPILITPRTIGAGKKAPFVLVESGEYYVENHCLYTSGSLSKLKRIQKVLNNPEYKKEYLSVIRGRSWTADYINELPLDKEEFDIEEMDEFILNLKKKKEEIMTAFEKFKKEFRPKLDLIYKGK